jgi:hypothetical protein
MYRVMRNTHLGIGLACIAMALMFAVSSLFVIYRDRLPDQVTVTEHTIEVSADRAQAPRTLALELLRNHGMKGDVLGIAETDGGYSFRIFRPGLEHAVSYSRSTGEATITARSWRLGQTLLQLHTTHAFWHEFAPAQLWAALSLLSSIGLLLLGASGIYLWWSTHTDRLIGGLLLAFSLSYGFITLLLTRLDS